LFDLARLVVKADVEGKHFAPPVVSSKKRVEPTVCFVWLEFHKVLGCQEFLK
jgi:hypothetical protein